MPSFPVDPQSASDIVAFSVGLIALMQALVWANERESGMLWFGAASLATTLLVIAGGHARVPAGPPDDPTLLAMYAIRACFAFGLTSYLGLHRRHRGGAIAVLVLPAAALALAMSCGVPGARLPGALPLLWFDIGLSLLCLNASRRTPGDGHAFLALAPLIGPAGALLDPWRGAGPHLVHDFPASVIGFGIVVLVVGLMRRSRESQRAQAHAQRMSNYYAALSHTNQAILRIKEPGALYEEICRICVESGQAQMVCIYLDDGDFATRVAAAGPGASLFHDFPNPWDITTPEARDSMTVRAMKEGVPLVADNYDQTPGPWAGLAREHGVRTLAWLPLRRRDRTTGVLMLAAKEPGFFDETLMRLLDEMTKDISFALDNIDREEAHRRTTREVEAGLERFSRLFHAGPVAAAIVSVAERRVIDVNDAICERYQASREALIGKTTADLAHHAIASDRELFYELLSLEGRVRNLVVRMLDSRGMPRVELMNAEPIDYLGQPCHLVMSLDITELRAAEEAREALTEAQAASRAKTEFLSRMSHELRTPLNAVLGFSSLLRQDTADRLTPTELAQLDHVQQAGWHLLRLINDVLDLSRIEAGQFGVQMRGLALAPLLDEALQMSELQAVQAGVALHAEYRAEPPLNALADPTRLRQVLLNVLSNAIKYNRPRGAVHVHVFRQADRAAIEVLDTGIGMTPQQLGQLFEPFNRLGRDRQGIEGTGIGLALTRQLMQLMDGEVSVSSEPGHGTRVLLALPLADGVWSDPLTTRDAPLADAVPADPAAVRGTVLYIEDNAVNTLLVEQLLARWKEVRFVGAEDGQTGLQLARTLHPDLVLLDMQLPDLDGLEVLRQLRNGGVGPGVPVVVLSASAMPDDIAIAREQGATDYWTKPLDFKRFIAGVTTLLQPGAAP